MYKCLISIHETFLQYFQKNFNTISCNVSRFKCNEYLKKVGLHHEIHRFRWFYKTL